MAGAAFQIPGDRFATATFGSTAFGTTAFGGSSYAAYDLPTYHFGSDDLTESYHKVAGEIVHTRFGMPVSVRSYATTRRWLVDFRALDESEIDDLQTYFEARTFNLLPAGDPASYHFVRWVGADFRPVPVGSGLYALQFEIEEILQ
jgi:hypothetical protein